MRRKRFLVYPFNNIQILQYKLYARNPKFRIFHYLIMQVMSDDVLILQTINIYKKNI